MEIGFNIINAIKSNNTCEQISELNRKGTLEKIIPEGLKYSKIYIIIKCIFPSSPFLLFLSSPQ